MGDLGLSSESKAMDVTSPETHYQVQCAEVRLLSSQLKPLKPGKSEKAASHFAFKIQVTIKGSAAHSRLAVHVIAVDEDEKGLPGFELKFSLLGVFVGEPATTPEVLAQFARLYTLSILWPYAREYTSDQLRRVGQPFDALPIINPQVVTERLIEAGLVEVEGEAVKTLVDD